MISEGIGVGILTETAIEDSDNIVAIPICDKNQPHFLISKAVSYTHLTLPTTPYV